MNSHVPAATARGDPARPRVGHGLTTVGAAANVFLGSQTSGNLTAILQALRSTDGVHVVRGDLFNRALGALRTHVAHPDLTLGQAAERYQTEMRHRGRPVGRRLIGTTLLVKGLEFDHAIVLDAVSLSRKELYVALTRGAKSVTIVSTKPVLHPTDQTGLEEQPDGAPLSDVNDDAPGT